MGAAASALSPPEADIAKRWGAEGGSRWHADASDVADHHLRGELVRLRAALTDVLLGRVAVARHGAALDALFKKVCCEPLESQYE